MALHGVDSPIEVAHVRRHVPTRMVENAVNAAGFQRFEYGFVHSTRISGRIVVHVAERDDHSAP